MSIAAVGPNADMTSYWSEQTGPKWVELQELLDVQIAPLGLAAMERSHVGAGERVVDVGCGCGQTSLQLAELVGGEGSVLGIDVSTPMLERARSRAARQGLHQVRFENADAQTFAFEPESVDVVYSRFGIMFFADPVAAFANLRRALRRGGRASFVCWQPVQRNPWILVPMAAAARHVELGPPPEPGTPGPFSLADIERMRDILEAAGFSDVGWESHDRELQVAGRLGLDQAVDFLMNMGPLGAVLRRPEFQEREDLRREVAGAVRESVAPYLRPDGGLLMSSASWIVTALSR